MQERDTACALRWSPRLRVHVRDKRTPSHLQNLVLLIRVLWHEPVQHDHDNYGHDNVHGQVAEC